MTGSADSGFGKIYSYQISVRNAGPGNVKDLVVAIEKFTPQSFWNLAYTGKKNYYVFGQDGSYLVGDGETYSGAGYDQVGEKALFKVISFTTV